MMKVAYCKDSDPHNPHQWWHVGRQETFHCNGNHATIATQGSDERLRRLSLPDADWIEHDGYPRDMDDYEEARRDAQRAINTIGANTGYGGTQGILLQQPQTAPDLQVGDLVRVSRGVMVKANLGETVYGVVASIDPNSGNVYVSISSPP